MCLGENKGFCAFSPGNSDERADTSSSLVTGFHIKAVGDESCLSFVMYSLSVFVRSWVYYEINLPFYWMFSVSHVVE
jgi:hypothetical protein